ncbi:MAG: N-acetyltransferase family protein [Gammaproteobacteria bacterium]|nr:N-acetyltransferase family protein [Gammaproteobacteria bacterium]
MDIEIEIDIATKQDLNRIVEIYNWAIENTSATFDTDSKTIQSQFGWFESHDEKHPVIVARENGEVLAWGSISPWSDRCAYSGTGEISFYVDPDFHRKGIGFNILKRLIEIGKEKNFRTLVSRIAGKSEASVHLHKKLGFSNIGTMKNVGKKFDEIIDVHLMQILF